MKPNYAYFGLSLWMRTITIPGEFRVCTIQNSIVQFKSSKRKIQFFMYYCPFFYLKVGCDEDSPREFELWLGWILGFLGFLNQANET